MSSILINSMIVNAEWEMMVAKWDVVFINCTIV